MKPHFAFCVALLCTPVLTPALAAGSGYHVIKTFPLGGDGGFDYLNRDPATGNLFLTRGSHVMVVDPDSGKLLTDITDLMGVHGTAFVGSKAYITEGTGNRLTVVDSKTLSKMGQIAVGTRPDGIIYDAYSNRIFSFNGGSKDATAVDPATDKAVGTVALGGKPEAASSDGAGTIFVNIEDKNELVAFDAKTLEVKAHYPLTGCASPSGQAMDTAHDRIFAVCDGNVMAVTDAKTGKVVTTVKIGDGPDASRFDAATGYIFSPNGQSGTLTVVHEDTPDKYSVVDTIATTKGARTMELDPKTHRVYTMAVDVKPADPTPDNPKPRPAAVPGSFRLIVLGR